MSFIAERALRLGCMEAPETGHLALALAATMATKLRATTEWTAIIENLLADLGQATAAHRTYLFRVHELAGRGLGQTCLYDWCAPGLEPLTGDSRNTNEDLTEAEPLMMRWTERRRRGEPIQALTRDLSGRLREDFEHQGVKSFVSVPVMAGGRWWGHLGLDDCLTERTWSESEIALLRIVAELLADAIERSGNGVMASEAARMAMLVAALDAVITVDESGRILEFNPSAERTFGYASAEVLGRPMAEVIIPVQHRKRHAAGFNRYLATGDARILGRRVETEAQRADGSIFPVELAVTEVRVDRRRFFTAYLRDISDRRRSRKALKRLAFFDQTTGLANRNGILKEISALEDAPAAMIAIQLRQFGVLAASLGRDFADWLLRAVAQRLAANLPENATLGRIGDSLFGVLLPGPVAEAAALAQLLLDTIRPAFHADSREIYLSATIGIAGSVGAPERLIGDAEMAAHLCEQQDIRLFDERLRAQFGLRLEIEGGLRQALTQPDQISVAYQPIFALDTGRVAGFEALARWHHPDQGDIAPGVFIPIAESAGLIAPLGRRILELAAGQIGAWRHELPGQQVFVGVNVSGVQFSEPDFAGTVTDILRAAGVDPSAIKIELTESTLMQKAEDAVLVLNRLKGLGVTVAVDDFGTGYSSLSYLRRFPTDNLKIDRSFVTAMRRSQADREIVRIIIDLAHLLGLSVVAEGIETEEERCLLQVMGCDFGQGFLLGRPMTADEAGRLLAESLEPERISA